MESCSKNSWGFSFWLTVFQQMDGYSCVKCNERGHAYDAPDGKEMVICFFCKTVDVHVKLAQDGADYANFANFENTKCDQKCICSSVVLIQRFTCGNCHKEVATTDEKKHQPRRLSLISPILLVIEHDNERQIILGSNRILKFFQTPESCEFVESGEFVISTDFLQTIPKELCIQTIKTTRQKKVPNIIYLDLNGPTTWFDSQDKGSKLQQVNKLFCKHKQGLVENGKWIPFDFHDHTSTGVTGYNFLKTQLSKREDLSESEKNTELQKLAFKFTETGQPGEKLSGHVDCALLLNPGIILTSCQRALQTCWKDSKIVLFTFGKDGPETVKELAKLTERRFTAAQLIRANDITLLVVETLSGKKVIRGLRKIRKFIRNVSTDLLIRGDFKYWNTNGRGFQFGKFFVHDRHVTQQAFDDVECFSVFANGEFRKPSTQEFVLVNPVDAMMDEYYFSDIHKKLGR